MNGPLKVPEAPPSGCFKVPLVAWTRLQPHHPDAILAANSRLSREGLRVDRQPRAPSLLRSHHRLRLLKLGPALVDRHVSADDLLLDDLAAIPGTRVPEVFGAVEDRYPDHIGLTARRIVSHIQLEGCIASN